MPDRFSEELLLTNRTGGRLYREYAQHLPIIDFHCHLLPREIRENRVFSDLGEIWLGRDHYKWRAMRAFGIDEKYITGDADYHGKYLAFAKILPELIGNPLYIWCALELKRYFDIDEPLSAANAEDIYRRTRDAIAREGITPRWCMERSNVEIVCTTDDPIDPLEHHLAFREDGSARPRVLPAFRPDKSLYCEKAHFPGYVGELAEAAGLPIAGFADLIAALERRLQFFKTFGTAVSDHGIEEFVWREAAPEEVDGIFKKARSGARPTGEEIAKYRSAFLAALGGLYHRHGFVMQLHIGTYQDANRRGVREVGAARGFDCADDSTSVKSVGGLLNRLNEAGTLPKTLLYPLDPGKMETFAVLAGGFCGGGERGLVQLGAPWWFNDQTYGIRRQFEAAGSLYPPALSVGMITDSRSFFSYPRHELYRRVLCDWLGSLVERGEYFSGEGALKAIIENMCHGNAKAYFGFGGR
ncbi:MAG: glucuronate isomerase [Planctomycetota bacterium]|jgi:glucuronate isomerase|nr:glucuronate isomerase [Planctomycetota bacterium]